MSVRGWSDLPPDPVLGNIRLRTQPPRPAPTQKELVLMLRRARKALATEGYVNTGPLSLLGNIDDLLKRLP